jgi:hypothetical protein
MRLRHALILAINTSILAVLFAFSAWLYLSSRAEVEAQVDAGLSRSAAITAKLAELREAELSSLAQSIAVSPMLRGALGTGDAETIRDVLRSIASKNALDVAEIAKGGRTLYAAGRADSRGRLLGRAALGPDGESLVVGQAPTPALLDAWSGITAARYSLRSGAGPPVSNLPAEDAALAARPAGDARTLSAQNRYYARDRSLLDGRFALTLYAPYEPFWTGFRARRDSLIVLGGFLFFGGLLLSVAFASLIERYAPRAGGGGGDAELISRLVEQIETARADLAARAPRR